MSKNEFIEEYKQLCKKHNLMVQYADECSYYLEEFDNWEFEYRIESLKECSLSKPKANKMPKATLRAENSGTEQGLEPHGGKDGTK